VGRGAKELLFFALGGSDMAGFSSLVLAAGKGKRMKSSLPKVLHPILGEPMIYYVLSSLREAGSSSIGVVVGHGAEQVSSYVRGLFEGVELMVQGEQRGTADAVRTASSWLSGREEVVVLPGDAPLVRSSTLSRAVERFRASGADMLLLSAELEDPSGYGRVVRGEGELVRAVVEEKDASPEQRAIREVNSGIYVFKVEPLLSLLPRVGCSNAQGEYYLTDLVSLFAEGGLRVLALQVDGEEVLGVNDRWQLALASRAMQRRINRFWCERGVSIEDPDSAFVGPRAVLEEDVRLSPFVYVLGRSAVGEGSFVGPNTLLRDAVLGRRVFVHGFCVVEGSTVCDGARLGPFAYVRDGALLEEEAFAGRFVEIKGSSIGKRTKVPHLSYIGDATVGCDTNIGAGTITCNFDGQRKHPTRIGDNCFIGSDTMLVAPVEVGDGAYTAAGSVITEDVPPGALGVGRARQRNIADWARRRALARGERKGD